MSENSTLPRWQRLWHGWIKPIGVVVIVVSTFRSAVADWNDVPSQSMEPTILVGDRVVVNKLAYGLRVPFTRIMLAEWSAPQRGEIVICFSPADGRRLVKRVVAVPGDTVELRHGRVLINGRPLVYEELDQPAVDPQALSDPGPHLFATEQLDRALHTVMYLVGRRGSLRSFGPITVPSDRFFVMGDNRDNSRDSRQFGFVQRRDIAGRAFGLAFSFDTSHGIRPRWNRFFRALE